MKTKHETLRHTSHGYLDLGPIRIPALPAILGFVDRGTGVIWYLSHDAPFLHVTTNDDLTAVNLNPSAKYRDIIIYGAYDGPWLDTNIQFMVRDGRIGYDYHSRPEQGVTGYGNPPLWTRRKVQRVRFRIYKGTAYKAEGDPLSFVDE